MQRDFQNAMAASHQALDMTIHSFGPDHRNIAALQYQVGWIHWWWNSCIPQPHYHQQSTQTSPGCRVALSHWKRTLKQQERFLLLQPSSNNDIRHRHPERRHHLDIAKTFQAMGFAYESCDRYGRAQTVFQAAIEIYQENTASVMPTTTTAGRRQELPKTRSDCGW
jgi:hypothetical protein